MEPLNKRAAFAPSHRRPHASRRGKLTLVTLIAILGMAVIIGFVGNAGYITTEKINTQNAADAVAFSSAQWMARGMNAVTATNHLLGEVTALVVVIEGLGGPEADLQMEAYPPQVSIPDEVNRTLADVCFVQGNPAYGTDVVGRFDKPFVKAIVKDLVSKKDKKHRAFATIYDSKLTLKRATTPRLMAKFFANWLFLVPPPWGYLSAAAAYVTHGVADKQLFDIGVEYVILEGLEQLVTRGKVMKSLKVDLLENKLVPALAAHGDFLAGRPSKKDKAKPNTEAAVVNHAVRNTLKHLGSVYNVEATVYPTAVTSGLFANLRLPIDPEAPPSGKGTPKGKEEKEWGNDKLEVEDSDNQLDKVFKEMKEKKEKIKNRIVALEKQLKIYEELITEVDDLRGREGITDEERATFDAERKKLEANIAGVKARIAKLKQDLKDLEAQEKKMREMVDSLAKAPTDTSGNLSADREHLALDKMNQAEERYTQWARATTPYMDAFRAPILRLFKDRLKRSGAAEHYEKWTNRFALTKSWQFRSGYRFERVSDTKGRWRKKANVEPLHMYLMAEKFDPMKAPPPPKPGATRIRKGDEVWTKDTVPGKKMAEEMFTLVAMTHRDVEPFFSPVIFPVASRFGMSTFAQAIYYNSNPQQAAPEKKTTVQPKVGWDTLNWDPESSPPEWGAPASVSPSKKWPWEIFTEEAAFVGQSRAKLNWQAKLMPVTKSRFEKAVPASAVALQPEMTLNLKLALEMFDKMVTH